jgi:hemoglobin/transferrin/lactoferrin receptor protein
VNGKQFRLGQHASQPSGASQHKSKQLGDWGQSMNAKTTRMRVLCAAASTLAIFIAGAGGANAQTIALDAITVTATKTAEAVSDALAASSVIGTEQIEQTRATSVAELFRATPGVWFQNRPDDPSTSISIRGLQDFGRVAVLIDGARQDFQRTGHSANGQFYIEPNTIANVDITRGPVANIYGSGAIGGVVYFRTKDAEDILKPGEKWAVESLGEYSSNKGWNTYLNAAVRAGDNIDLFVGGTYRDQSNYKDGDGNRVPNTASETWTGTAKATLRPADGHTLKFGYTQFQSDFTSGIPFIVNFPPPLQASSIYDTGVLNQIATARWLYSKPDDNIFNWDANVYWTRTSTDQTKTDGLPPMFGGIGNIGDTRNFSIETLGFNLNNTSRFESGAFRHAFTFGADGLQDKVDTSGFGVVFTPSGERSLLGAFAQWKMNYSSWLEVISALRFDQYRLEGGAAKADGSRVSPKITVGVTPFHGFQPYVTYAEGYRAPAVTETLVAGLHPIVFAPFTFLQNPSLRPEVGKTKEVGINLKYDDVFKAGDRFRGKVNAYRNDVDDYIDLTGVFFGTPGQDGIVCTTPNFGGGFAPGCQQYQNVASARLEGAEFETMYDSGTWFAGLAGSHVRGKNVNTGAPLATVPPDFLTTTIGTRLNERVTVSARWQAVAAKTASEIPVDSRGFSVYAPTSSFNIVSLYLGYKLSENAQAALAVENLLNEQYSPYLTVFANPSGSGTPLSIPMPGITVKASLKVRFGG